LAEEWTCEANPETVHPQLASMLRESGVDRISLGAQSFQARVLESLGRDHDPRHVESAIETLRTAGFEELSVDLMFAAPQQTIEDLDRDLDRVLEFGLPHLSAYCLSYETGTPLTQRWQQGRVPRASEDHELRLYRRIRERLTAAGYRHYEISNYALPGHECKHNLVYWMGRPYYGFGLGAGSYEGGVRRTNTRNLHAYLGPWPGPDRPPHDAEELPDLERARELVVLGLRLADGVEHARLESETGFAFEDLYDLALIQRWQDLGLVELDAAGLRCTPAGFEVADSLFADLV
jgi:oxygen-independent coproporphyrinogen-3 oxidase